MAVSDRPLVMRTQEEDVVLILVFSNIQSTTGNLYYKSSGKLIIDKLFNKEAAHAWIEFGLGSNVFLAPTRSEQFPQFVRFRSGQPLGFLSSWPLFALSHHFLVVRLLSKVQTGEGSEKRRQPLQESGIGVPHRTMKPAKTPPSTKPKTSKIFGLIVLGKFESTGTLLDVEPASKEESMQSVGMSLKPDLFRSSFRAKQLDDVQNQNKRYGEFLSDVRNLGSFLTGVQPEVPALLVIRVFTDAESESAGGNSEAGELKLVKDFHLPTPIAESSTLPLVTSRSMESYLSLSELRGCTQQMNPPIQYEGRKAAEVGIRNDKTCDKIGVERHVSKPL
ncbi:hypothetical protein U1Q18_041273 [Sarracenia purpurea var. burkii]